VSELESAVMTCLMLKEMMALVRMGWWVVRREGLKASITASWFWKRVVREIMEE
jgi:hypothetical protein